MKTNRPYQTATLADVARAAGVSPITASRALTKPDLVSAKTIARVQEAAQATGYIPNMLAGGLRSTHSMAVACIVPAISVAQFLPTVQALTDSLAAAGYQLMLAQTGYDASREDALINAMVARRPDSLIFAGLVQSATARQKLKRLGIPVVETWDYTEHPIDMLVGFSHEQVGAAVAAFFRKKGYQRVGIATGDDHRATLRRQGFVAAWGSEVPLVIGPAPSNMELGRLALDRLLLQKPDLQAVFCSSDQLAQGLVTEALRRGLRVPQDLAICGFGDADFAAHMLPALTTVQIRGAEIGARAAQLTIARCAGQAVEQPITNVGFKIIERDST